MEGLIGYLNYRDIQLFFKRLIQNIRRITNEKIHYYVVGEYGPTTFRPHFHILLFHNSKELRQSIRQFVSKSWRFGDSDTQSVWSSASCYVAGYVNSTACLPDFFKNSLKESKRQFDRGTVDIFDDNKGYSWTRQHRGR
jgi:hypothetical protein